MRNSHKNIHLLIKINHPFSNIDTVGNIRINWEFRQVYYVNIREPFMYKCFDYKQVWRQKDDCRPKFQELNFREK